MTMRRDPMWSDEERELAAQLARIAPHGEPSADLDARILAMAERDLAGVSPVATARRRPHRWPVWLGAAASLTVVAGLVWQLQPVLQPRETISYEAPAPVAADTDPNGRRQPIDYVESAAADAAMTPPPPPPPAEPMPAQKPSLQTRPAASSEPLPEMAAAPVAPPPAPPATRPVAANAAAQADAAAIKSMAADRAMAQEAPHRPVPTAAEAAVAAPVSVYGSPAAAPPAPAPARALKRAASTSQSADELIIQDAPPPDQDRAGFDARPPITADTPEVQRAWLKRIRELRDAGDVDDARLSLAAFVKRNPKAEIPADLRPLLPATAAPSTQP